jgi:pimeloyl-ACP methyl ester carboxylesterase
MALIETRTVSVDGRDVRYYTAGSGDPLVVIHGGGGDARTWENNIRELARTYTVYAPDLPGYGGSQPLAGRYYIPELAAFLDRFTRKLGLETFHLIGHSLGGGIALTFALDFPRRLRKLVLVSSLCLGNEIAFWVRLLSLPALLKSVGVVVMATLRGIKWVFERFNPAEYVMPMSPASVTIGGAITTFRSQSLVLKDRLAEVGVPTLLVWGKKDPIVPVRHAYEAAAAMPRAQVKVFGKVGHDVHRDALAGFSSAVSGFLG